MSSSKGHPFAILSRRLHNFYKRVERTLLVGRQRVVSLPGPNATCSIAPLPQELVDAIVAEISDSATLLACALVSTTFRYPSQRKIFRTLRVQHGTYRLAGSQKKLGFDEAADLFTASPYLALCVEDLAIDLLYFESPCGLHTILRLATNLSRLTVFGGFLGWCYIDPNTSEAFLECLTRPCLQRLRMNKLCDIPLEVYTSVLGIPVVSLHDVYVDENLAQSSSERGGESLELPFAPRLRHLTLTGSTASHQPVFDRLLHSRYSLHTRIKRLETVPGLIDTARLLTECAGNLEYLTLDLQAFKSALPPPPRNCIPTRLPALQNLEIKAEASYLSWLPDAFPLLLADVITALPSLETMHLWISLPSEPGPDALPHAVAANMTHLRRVRCSFRYQWWQPNLGVPDLMLARFIEAMDALMPGLRGSNVLVCERDTGSLDDEQP